MSKVLIVENNEDIVFCLKHSLAVSGHEIYCSNSILKALEQIKRSNIDLVIIDYFTKGERAVDFVLKLKEAKLKAVPKVVLLTFKDLMEEEILYFTSNDIHFLKKPFTPDEITQKVNRILE